MYPIPPTETLVETKTCKHCGVSFPITDKDLEFYEKVSPVFNGQKYPIPTPTLCPDCRQQRRLSFRNERKLYKRKCDATGQDIVSCYSPDKSVTVYRQDFWWSDKWDPMSYGKDFDFSRGFFEQFGELLGVVPLISLWNLQGENAEYNNNCYKLNDSYMSFNSDLGEKYYYSYISEHCSSIYDSAYMYHCENCYQCCDAKQSYNCYFSSNISESSNCYFSSDLIGSEYCFGSHGFSNAKYIWFNEQVTKDEWDRLFQTHFISSNTQSNREKSEEIRISVPKKYAQINNCQNCIGDYIGDSKNVVYSYGIQESENLKYVSYVAFGVYDVQDAYALGDVKLGYETNEGGVGVFKCAFIKNSMEGLRDSYYTIFCGHGSFDLFGCIGLKNKSYCILNKQYTKEEYETLVPKIIEHMMKTGEWGEFFPSSMSPFGYNETVAMEYYPLSRDVAVQRLYNWSDYEAPFPKVEKIIPAAKLPEDITKIPDDILNWAIECEVTGKPFRIIKQELEFYRKHNLPIPRRHPDQRHLDRMALRNPRKLYERKCDKCEVEMMTTYSPERPEMVYCEGCYNKEIL